MLGVGGQYLEGTERKTVLFTQWVRKRLSEDTVGKVYKPTSYWVMFKSLKKNQLNGIDFCFNTSMIQNIYF